MKKSLNKKNQEGFSLIELSVVLIIMGLLMGGILKGRDLIESARLKRVISQVNEYRMATSLFLDTYEAFPGDFKRASEVIHPSLSNGNGNGNGIVDGAGLASDSEALAFWAHLAGAGLMAKPGRQGEEKVGEYGKGAPTSSLGGGFTVEHNPCGLHGLWFVLGKKNGDHGDGALLTPAQARNLDKKLANGHPKSGKIRSFDGSDVKANACLTQEGEYNLENHEPACSLFFQL